MIIETIKEKIGTLPIEALSKESEFTKRKAKKIKVLDYVSSFVSCVFEGDISQANWARTLSAHSGNMVSEQAIQGKVQFRHEAFSKRLLAFALAKNLQMHSSITSSCKVLQAFKRVLVHDSTCIQLPDGLKEYFPGSCSQHASNAIARTQLSIDLHTGSYEKVAFTSYRKNDQSYAVTLAEQAQADDLHLFDLGYFKIGALDQIVQSKASFLCRYKSNVNIYLEGQQVALELVKKLKELDKNGITGWDEEVSLGAKHQLKVRIVAMKLPQKVAQARRRKKKNHRDKRKKYLEPYLYLLGWNIFITNLAEPMLPAAQILRIYGLRWRIEIIFKAWKSRLNYARLFANQSYSLPSRGVIQLHLILFTITLFLTKWYQHLAEMVFLEKGRILSLLKFCSFLKDKIEFFFDKYHNDRQTLINLLAYHYCYDRRKDRLNFFETLYHKKLS